MEKSKKEDVPLLFLITSDTCAHCRNIERELKGFLDAVAEAGFEAEFGYANCDQSKLCAILKITGMPRLFVIKGSYDDRTLITGEPKKEIIKADVFRQLNPNVTMPVASSVDQVKDIIKHSEVMTFAAFYDPTTEEGQAVKEKFWQSAENIGKQYYQQQATIRWLDVEIPDGNFDDVNMHFGVNENKAVRLLPKRYESKYEESVLDAPLHQDTATVLSGLGGDVQSDWWVDNIVPLVGEHNYYTELHYRYIQKTHIRKAGTRRADRASRSRGRRRRPPRDPAASARPDEVLRRDRSLGRDRAEPEPAAGAAEVPRGPRLPQPGARRGDRGEYMLPPRREERRTD